MKLAFTPWKDSQFSPQYLLKQVNEKRTDYSTGSPDTFQYPKSMSSVCGAANTAGERELTLTYL